MTETCHKAVTSLRACARRNLQQARTYREEGRLRIAGYHWLVALSCRADANALASTARPLKSF